MKYWVRVGKESLGPVSPEQIRKVPGVTENSLVCPEGATAASDWRRLREVPELLRAFRPAQSAPPPPPPPPETGSSTPTAPLRLVKCQDCGKAVSREAPNCPSCGSPIPIRTSWKRIGIALAIVFGLPLLFLLVAALLTPSPNDPIAPAHVQGGLAQPEDQERAARIRKVEAERKANQEKAEHAAQKFRGTPIDYPTFFAKAKGTGLKIEKRYTFQATVTHAFCLYDPAGEHDHLMCVEADIDENNSERLEQFLKGPDRQVLRVTAKMEGGTYTGKVIIVRLE